MSNTFTKPSDLIAGTTARSADINDRVDSTETGFDNVEVITNAFKYLFEVLLCVQVLPLAVEFKNIATFFTTLAEILTCLIVKAK